MSNFIIHIGTPRTGTTALQKNIFPKCKKHLALMKKAYSTTGKPINNEKTFIIGAQPEGLIDSLAKADPEDNAIQFFNDFIATPALGASGQQSRERCNQLHFLVLGEAIMKASKMCTGRRKSILISSERLIDTGASLVCKTKHDETSDWSFGYKKICEAISKNLSQEPLITVCMREPISYLRSKYLRTFIQRRAMKTHRDLSPTEYIQKQATLETKHPGTSVLTPAMHSEFIKELQTHAFVKAFGFQELLASDDVFTLMGLQGEDKYAFRDFPRENKLPFTKEQEQAIEVEITNALKQYGFFDRIMRAQMFE